MAAPAKNAEPKVSSYLIMLRYFMFFLFFFGVLFLVGMFGVVAEA
jgi:hypothetical protein